MSAHVMLNVLNKRFEENTYNVRFVEQVIIFSSETGARQLDSVFHMTIVHLNRVSLRVCHYVRDVGMDVIA